MCLHGETEKVTVRIAADLSSDGHEKLKRAEIDRCIAPIVRALQEGGIDMRGSCCGHGKAPGKIELQDGRTLEIHSSIVGGYQGTDAG